MYPIDLIRRNKMNKPECPTCAVSIYVTSLARGTVHYCRKCDHAWGGGWNIVKDLNKAFKYLFGHAWEAGDKLPCDLAVYEANKRDHKWYMYPPKG